MSRWFVKSLAVAVGASALALSSSAFAWGWHHDGRGPGYCWDDDYRGGYCQRYDDRGERGGRFNYNDDYYDGRGYYCPEHRMHHRGYGRHMGMGPGMGPGMGMGPGPHHGMMHHGYDCFGPNGFCNMHQMPMEQCLGVEVYKQFQADFDKLDELRNNVFVQKQVLRAAINGQGDAKQAADQLLQARKDLRAAKVALHEKIMDYVANNPAPQVDPSQR